MECISLWAGVDLFCARLNLTYKTIDPQQSKQIVAEMHKKLLDRFVALAYPENGAEVVREYLENPESEQSIQFEKDWSRAVAMLNIARSKMAIVADERLKKKDATVTRSVLVDDAMLNDVVASYVEDNTSDGKASVVPIDIPQVPTSESAEEGGVIEDQESSEGPGASQDTPIVATPHADFDLSKVPDSDVRSISSVIQDMMGESRMHLFGEFINFLHDQVAKGWIDQEVDSDGNIIGFSSVEHSSRAILGNINDIMVKYYENRAQGTINASNSKYNTSSKFLFFKEGTQPKNLSIDSEGKDEEGNTTYTVYKHNLITDGRMQASGNQQELFIIVAPSFDEAVTAVRDDIQGLSVDYFMDNSINEDGTEKVPTDAEDQIDNRFSNLSVADKHFDDDMKEVLFSYMLSNNYVQILKHFYPQLAKGFKSKYRVGYVANDTTVAAADQDSATVFVHKRTTPRLNIVVENDEVVSITKNNESPYLKAVDFELIADIITEKGFRRDAIGLAEDIKKEFTSFPKEATSQVLASIYYRFFAPEDYKVSMIERGREVTKTYRSYSGIVSKNSREEVDLDDYLAWAEKNDEGKTAPFENSNRNLAKSLSGVITSLNSTVKHESFMSSNGVGRATNTKSYNIISKYKAEMAAYPRAIEQSGAVFTNPEALKDLKVLSLTTGTNERQFQINIEGTNVKYKVRLNPIVEGKFKSGFPFTVLEFPDSPLSFSELRSIYGRFPVSPAVLTDGFMVEFSSAARMLEQPEQQNRALEQFLLSTVLMSEMNKATSDILTIIDSSNTPTTYGNPFKYDPVDTMHGYKRALEASLRGIYGEDGKVYARDHSGNNMAIVTPKNKISESATLAKRMGDPSSIHRGGLLTGPAPTVKIDGFFTKTGIKVGETVKKNQDMTIHEQAELQIEQAFLQTLANSGYKETMLQFGVFSDKTNIPLVRMQSDEKFFFPVTSNGTGLDTKVLRDRMIVGQQTYWNNLAEEIKMGWLVAVKSLPFPVDISSTDTLFEMDAKLRAAQIPYGEFTWTNPATGEVITHRGLSASSGLVKNAMITMGPKGVAVIPQHVLNNIALFNDAALAEEFVNTNLKMFKKALSDEGYTKISEQSLKTLTAKLPNAGLNADSGREILLDAFFFNSNTLGGELLRIHTGGFAQFKLPKASNITVLKDGKIDAKATLANVKALPITNAAGEQVPLSSLSLQQVIDSVGNSKDKSKILYSAIIHNKSLSPDVKAKALIFDDMAVTSSTQFIDQVKRNAGMSSTGQHPRLAGANEPGVLLGKSSKNITIEDPSFDLTVLGKSGKDGQDVYDAVQIGHPLYFIKLANSLGGAESNYSPTGAPVKDITNEVDAKGFYRFQKKATFDMFSTELTKKGTPELYNMMVKMNTAVRFNTPFMMVPKVDAATGRPVRGDFSTVVTEEMWLNGGYGLEMLLDTVTGSVVTMESLLRPLREGTTFEKQQATAALKARLANSELKTDKVQKNFKDLQHLWEYFGSIDNKNAWNMVANVIGNHSISPNDLSLATATFPVRDSYVEKVGFKSQEKTGSKQLLSDASITDPGYVYGDESFNGWSEVDNTYHCVILQADHNPDTSHGSKATINHNEDPEDPNHIPMITQILSAIVGEGNTMAEVIAVYKAMGISSQIFTKEVDSKIATIVDNIAAKENISKGTAAYNDLTTRATFEYLTGVLKKSLSTREAPGIAGDLVTEAYKEQLSFDIKQILPVATSSVNSDFNRNTVRMTFPGGQYIVAPSHDFIKTFTVAGKDGFTRDDINKISINPGHPLYNSVVNDPQFAIKPPVMADLLPSDILTVTIVNPAYATAFEKTGLKLGDKIQYSKLSRLLSELDPDNSDAVVHNFVQDNMGFRFSNARGSDNRLQWTQYRRHNTDGSITNIKDTEEYKAFQAISNLSDIVTPSTAYSSAIVGTVDLNNLVGDDLSVNWDLLDKLQTELFSNDKWNLRTRPEKHAGEQFTWEHIQNVVNSALTMDMPEGVDRKQVVIAALLHDIGKPYRNEDHGFDSADIMNKLFKDREDFKLIRLAIRHHMLDGKSKADYRRAIMEATREGVNPTDFVNLVLAVKAADITRGRDASAIDELSGKSIQNTITEEASNHSKAFSEIITDLESGNLAVPKNLIRHYYFTSVEGVNKEVFTNSDNTRFESWLKSNSADAQLQTVDFINKVRKSDKGLIKRFEKPLYNLLQSEGWTSEPAEFYMPSMHKNTFLLRDTDSLYDVIGATDPDYNKLISLGVIKPGTYTRNGKSISLTDNEDIYRQLNTNYSAINTIIGLPSSPYFQQMTPEQQAAWTEFKTAKDAQNKSMVKFFKQRVSKLYESNFNAFRTAPSVAIAIDRMEKQVKNSPSGSELAKALNLLLIELKEATVTVDTTDADILNKVFKQGEFPNGPITQLINKKAAKLASGFTTSLEFITARIPAQGKQSGTIGKIKNFVFSSRNSCYGPLEMLKMTGADYDIDKQNMMTWSFDEDGVLIDWKPFLDANGQISMDKFNTWSEGMPTKEANAYFKSAIQNFIVHNITAVFKSPKNAIEANTPVSMDKTKQAKTEPDLSQASKAKSVEDILKLREHASPFNPADMFKYEKLNMDGKSGIGIFASDLKGYFAAYFATITSDPATEGEYIKFKSNSGLNITQSEKLGIRQDAVQFYDLKTGELAAESSTIANSGKYVGEGKGISIKAKEGIEKLQKAETDEEQIAILSEYVDAINASNNANVDEQAWEDLSELLSAATDNAKELILGQINATTATSSIISTMVRMGIDLKYALQLVGHTDPKARPRTVKIGTKTYNDIRDIRGLIRKIDEVGDTQKDGGGFARLLPILETMQPDAPLGAGEKELRDYVSDPFRQLYTFAKMTEEFGLLSSLLSINQGLKNSAFEGWKFISGIEARLNDITEGKPSFDFERFIKSASRAVKDGGDGGAYVSEIIKAFDAKRTGINVPFILSKNSHYFGYYEAMFKAKELVNVVSKVDSTVETIIDNMTAKAPRLKRKVTDKDYKGIQNLIYGIGVEGYLKDVTKLFVIDGKTFDLSIATAPMTTDTSVGGRYEFIQYLPEAVNQAANFGADNHFLSSIPAQDSTVDYITQVRVPILKGPNLHNVTADRFAELKVGLSALKKSNRELYDALFLYSLITNKGSYASGSFIALYDPEKYVDFSGYIKKNANAISSIALNSNNKDIVKYNNPIFIEALSTSKDNIDTYVQAVNNEEQITEDFFDYGGEMGDDFFDNEGDFEEVHRRRTYLDVNEKLFHTEGITKGKMSKNGIKDDIIRSKETGLIYKWDKFVNLWIPMVQRIPGLVIPFSGINQTGMITDTGFDEGWETTLPEVTPSGEPVKAKIIAYVDKYFETRFKKDLAKSLHLAPNTNFDGKQYLIKRDNGSYDIVSREFLLAGSTDGLELSDHRIGKRYSTIKDKLKSDISQGFFTLNNVLYDRKVEGSVPTNSVTVNPSRVGRARNMYGSLNVSDVKSIIDGLDESKKFNMSDTALNNQYEALKQQYLANAVFEQFETFDPDKLNHLYSGRERRAAASIIKETNDMFDSQSSVVSKLITLYKGKSILEERFGSLEGAKLTPETTKDLVQGKAPSIAIEAFKDQTLLDNTSWGQAQQLMRLMGVTNDSFEKLVKDTLLKKGGKLDIYIGGEETKGRPDGSTELVSRVITNKEVKPKGYSSFSMEHAVPNDLRNKFSREASPDVLNSLINVLNDRFPGSNFSRMSTAQIEDSFGAHYSRPGVKAFVMNGEVIFNQERITLDTPIHEYMHIYMQHLKLEDPELYHQLITQALEHPLAESMGKTYKDITRFELGEEVFVSLVSAHMMGETSENTQLTALLDSTSKGSTVFGRILDFFKDIFSKAFGVSEDKLDLTLTDSLGSIIEKLGNELAYGKGSMLKDFSNETKQLITQSRQGAMIDYKQVLDLLTEKGFIKRVCV